MVTGERELLFEAGLSPYNAQALGLEAARLAQDKELTTAQIQQRAMEVGGVAGVGLGDP